jgi:A/G-specific adenine glycosylase
MQKIQRKLHRWYHENKRDLPWRHTPDAYQIWISEIMLQQTQVAQGLPYYLRFMERFPAVQDLANAHEDEVLKLWQGLGYYSRARNLHAASKQVINDFNGIFPVTYDELITLKGVGDYSASAVSSFSSGEARACVDGNVIRVICRLFGIDEPYDTSVGKKMIKYLADELLYKKDPALHNQSMMEFGALQCTPKNTQCDTCVLNDQCVAYSQGKVAELPIKSKRTKVKDLFLYYFVFSHQDTVLIKQRSDSGIWRNLYEFPLLESAHKITKKALLDYIDSELGIEGKPVLSFSENYTHILSHRRIQASFILIKTDSGLSPKEGEIEVSLETFHDYPVSRLIERYWNDINPSLNP